MHYQPVTPSRPLPVAPPEHLQGTRAALFWLLRWQEIEVEAPVPAARRSSVSAAPLTQAILPVTPAAASPAAPERSPILLHPAPRPTPSAPARTAPAPRTGLSRWRAEILEDTFVFRQ